MAPPRRLAALRRFRRDQRGVVLVFVAVALPALIGLVGLAIDATRLFVLDAQLASVADAAAIAGASRLDRADGAMARARAAGDALVNRAGFADGAGPRVGLSYRFAARLSDLRADPTYTLADQDSAQAAYVEATTGARSITASFLQAVGARVAPVRRRAIASSLYYACDVSPLVMCQRDPESFAARAAPGRQYLSPLGTSLDDGALALLDAPGEREPRAALRGLAGVAPRLCLGEGVALRRDVAPLAFEDALNVRFDRYVNRLGPIAPDLATAPPAPIVIQGKRFESCASNPDGGSGSPPYRLPRDAAFTARGVLPYDLGQGDWRTAPPLGGSGAPVRTALDEYLAWNHGDKSPLVQDSLRSSATRYELYLQELGLTRATEARPVLPGGGIVSNGFLPTGGPRAGPFATGAERATPACYRGREPADDARRRLLYVAIADCGSLGTAGAERLSRHVGRFFLTEPAEGGRAYLELVNLLTPTDSDGRLRHVVQLVDTD